MELRLRRKPFHEIVQDFDAFPKVAESVLEQKRASGGIIFIICVLLTVWLVWGEIVFYNEEHYFYNFLVDTDFDRKLSLKVDLVVASPCESMGADVMDATGQSLPYFHGELVTEPTRFELNAAQRDYLRFIRTLKEQQFGRLQRLDQLLYTRHSLLHELASRAGDESAGDSLDACRVHGVLKINKVAGNLHITAGKSLPLVGGGHAHLNFFGLTANFSHRILQFSFDSDAAPGMVQALDGVEKTDTSGRQLFQYHLQLVPTSWQGEGDGGEVRSCQLAATQRDRQIDHERGSHGMAGLFFKYDLSPVMVRVAQQRQSLVQLLLRLCCVVGGVFATSGFLNNIVTVLSNRFLGAKRFDKGN